MYCKTQRLDSARLCSLPYPLIDDQIQLTDNKREKNVRLGLERWLSG